MLYRIVAALAFLFATLPAISQTDKGASTSESMCADKFKSADLNDDGVLTVSEIPKVAEMPEALAKERVLVSRQEFMAACAKIPPTQAQQFDKPAPPSPHSTGQTVSPDTKGQQQPQGPTGPLETKSGGAPAESPQGQTPAGMQAAPDGSSKTIVDPSVKSPVETPPVPK